MRKGFKRVTYSVALCAVNYFNVYRKTLTSLSYYFNDKVVLYVVCGKSGINTYFMQNEFYHCVCRVYDFVLGGYYE